MQEKPPIRIAILIRKMEVGGAERQALELAKGLLANGHLPVLITFYPEGKFWHEALEANIPIISLEKFSRWDVATFLFRLIKKLKELNVDILHTFDTVPGLFGSLAQPFIPNLKLAWGIRASNVDLSRYDYSRQLVFQFTIVLSHFANLIIANSKAGSKYVHSKGYPSKKLVVVANGIDTDRFRIDRVSARVIRQELAIQDDELLIGIAARLDPMKDHATFLKAARYFLDSGGKAKFICAGDGPERESLISLAHEMGISQSVRWLGTRSDMPAIYNAMDINTLTSAWGEGFPNTIAEAMACGTPCVSTTVGDSTDIVLGEEYSIHLGDASALSKFWLTYSNLGWSDRQDISHACRAKISMNYSIGAMIENSVQHYTRMLSE
jgi:glycosyltransferase involved in cell wall biosynthesis